MLQKLNRSTANIQTQRPIKVLQFGEGNFLRGFVDWIVDVMNEKAGFNGNVKLVQPISNGMVDMVNAQDGLYHVLLNGIADGKPTEEIRLIDSVVGGINPYEDFEGFLSTALEPELQFVISNTTEAGIQFDPSDSNTKKLPGSFPGKLTLLLYYRFSRFDAAKDKGLFIIPCELIDKNGEMLKAAILQYIDHWRLPLAFKQWVEESNRFCNTLVDRIVPGFPRETISEIHKKIGFEDNLVVMAEPFHLWVIEASDDVKDAFPANKANLQVKFVDDIAPYRTRKVRILNGAHTAMVPVAYLFGLRTVRASIDDAVIGKYVRALIFEEIIPTLDLPEEELKSFANDVIERFQNPFIKHELITISLNSIAKFKTRVLPTILTYFEQTGKLPKGLVYSMACLIRFYKGVWQNEAIKVNDDAEIVAFFRSLWQEENMAEVSTKVLSNTSFWGQDLTKIPGFKIRLQVYLEQIVVEEERGLQVALAFGEVVD